MVVQSYLLDLLQNGKLLYIINTEKNVLCVVSIHNA